MAGCREANPYGWSEEDLKQAESTSVLLAADVVYDQNLTCDFFGIVDQLMPPKSKKVITFSLLLKQVVNEWLRLWSMSRLLYDLYQCSQRRDVCRFCFSLWKRDTTLASLTVMWLPIVIIISALSSMWKILFKVSNSFSSRMKFVEQFSQSTSKLYISGQPLWPQAGASSSFAKVDHSLSPSLYQTLMWCFKCRWLQRPWSWGQTYCSKFTFRRLSDDVQGEATLSGADTATPSRIWARKGLGALEDMAMLKMEVEFLWQW